MQSSSLVAQVSKQCLYAADVEEGLPADSPERNIAINRYAEAWACKQLLVAEGMKHSSFQQQLMPAIEQQVATYKEDLLVHHFLDDRVKRDSHNEVSLEEITAYYKGKQDDFMLNHAIVKGLFLVIPKRTRGVNAVKSWMLSSNAADRKKLKDYCKRHAQVALLEEDKWVSWESILARMNYYPLGSNDPTRVVKTNKFIHAADRKYLYLLKINQYKLAEEKATAPLEVVADRIKAIILHKRKLKLIKEIKANLLREAKKNHTCVIHVQ
ncbi:MAG: hypothetical protein NQ127_00760 [Candidatus Cardinium sp.]|nr:hypothetical protein [Candidatus Cardinium sp.]